MFGTRMLASARRAVFIGALVWIAPSSFAAKPTPKPANKPAAAAAEHGGGSVNKEAQALMDAGDFDGAIAVLTEQITKNPKAWHSYYQRGLASLRKVQKAQATSSRAQETNAATTTASPTAGSGSRRRRRNGCTRSPVPHGSAASSTRRRHDP